MLSIVVQFKPSNPSTKREPELSFSACIQKLNLVTGPGYMAVVILPPVCLKQIDGDDFPNLIVSVSRYFLLNVHPSGARAIPLLNPSATRGCGTETVNVGEALTSIL